MALNFVSIPCNCSVASRERIINKVEETDSVFASGSLPVGQRSETDIKRRMPFI